MTEHAQLGQPDPNRETQQASIHDVAQAVGVSVSTVSRSFTRPNLVSPRTREKVLRAAAELHFSISRSAMALKSGRSFRIALLLPSPITEWFNVNVYAGLNEVLQPAGYDISVFQISTNDARHRFFSEMPVRRNADAVVLCSFNTREDELSLLLGMGVPVVGINTSSLVGLDAGTSTDDVKSAEIATKHLISLGHRNIAYIYTSHDTPFTYSADDRHEGFENPFARLAERVRDHSPVRDFRVVFMGNAVYFLCFQQPHGVGFYDIRFRHRFSPVPASFRKMPVCSA